MKFSILIAHYNNAFYFKDCFQSILNQSYTNWEAIIVDDCSNDSEKILLKELISSDNRFFLYENTENRGVGYTKKRCAELATGDICGFLDPDDALTPDALEESIKAYAKKNTVASYSQFYICDDNLKPQKLSPHSKKIRNGNKEFLNIFFYVTHFFTYKKEVYDDTEKMDDSLTSSIDQDLYLKLYEKGNFQFVKNPLYLYRIHEKGVSQDKKKKQKLYKNWHITLYNTLKRRNLTTFHGRNIDSIDSLPEYVYKKQNTFLSKLFRKFF